MKKRTYIEKRIETMAIKKALAVCESELNAMDDGDESIFIDLFKTGIVVDATKLKRKLLIIGVNIFKNQLKKP